MIHDTDLRCPATGRPLTRVDGHLQTDDGTRTYPVIDGVPILIAEERSLFRLDEFRSADGLGAAKREPRTRRVGRRLAGWLPSDSANLGTAALIARLSELLMVAGPQRDGRPRVLVVGGGIVGAGLEPLLVNPELDLTETDVWLGPRTELVCDGHDLPFRDGTFDAVVIQAVLEHVSDPARAVNEIHRVLAADGLVYSEIPFMQQVHEGAFDFTRWTYVGQRRLFRRFDEVASGVVCGPAMALAWSLRYLAVSMAGSSTRWGKAIAHLVPLLTFWLPWLDRMLVHKPGALDAASSIGFLGRRREEPLSDEVIVAAYRGLNASPSRWT